MQNSSYVNFINPASTLSWPLVFVSECSTVGELGGLRDHLASKKVSLRRRGRLRPGGRDDVCWLRLPSWANMLETVVTPAFSIDYVAVCVATFDILEAEDVARLAVLTGEVT